MQRFLPLNAIACPLGLENVDTDQLISARFMSRPRSAGYGGFLLHDLRFDPQTAQPLGCILDDPRFADAKILVARRNFGTGSSREAAVYALWDYGIRCVIAPSFGDIFQSNAIKNGLLTAVVSDEDAETLLQCLDVREPPSVGVDLEKQAITCVDRTMTFAIDAVPRLQLLNGWDDLDLTVQHKDAIDRFREGHHKAHPWAVPTL